MGKRKDSSTPLGVTSTEQNAILQKLSTLEDLLKKKDDKPLTFKEACSYLGYAPSYLYKLTYRKVIPHYKPTGKVIFFSKNEIDEWIFKSKCEKLEDRSENDGSTKFTTADPNQVDMFDKPGDEKSAKRMVDKREAVDTEVIIKFPLKSRRKKNVLRD